MLTTKLRGGRGVRALVFGPLVLELFFTASLSYHLKEVPWLSVLQTRLNVRAFCDIKVLSVRLVLYSETSHASFIAIMF